MRKEYLEVGKIVSTHGVRGELRVQPWCDTPQFMKQFQVFYLDKQGEKPMKAESIRPHGTVVLVKLSEINSIPQAETLRGKILYIRREDAKLAEGDYFVQELCGCEVRDADSGKLYGILSEVSQTGANDVWHVKNGEEEYLMPAVKEMIAGVDIENGLIQVRPIRGLFDGEAYED